MAFFKRVEVKDMMRAREERALAQYGLLKNGGKAAVSFTLNIAGPYKVFPGVYYCFERGLGLLKEALATAGFEAEGAETRESFTGLEALLSVKGDAKEVKKVCAGLDDSLPVGRLFDLDVLYMSPEGFPEKVSREELGFSPRKCLICELPSSECAAIRRHSAKELSLAAAELIFLDFMGRAAEKALTDEVSLTPKPGLVDLKDSGAHRDMDHVSFERSAGAIGPYITEMARAGFEYETGGSEPGDTGPGNGAEPSCLEQSQEVQGGGLSSLAKEIKALGIEAEKAMMRATGGVNTHRGAVYSMGIIAASLGAAYAELIAELESGRIEGFAGAEGSDERVLRENSLADAQNVSSEPDIFGGSKLKGFMRSAVRAASAELAEELDALRTESEVKASHGSLVLEKYGAKGIRREAAEGFPLAFEALSEYEKSGSWKKVLLYLMTKTDDTTVLYRKGPEGLRHMKSEAQKLYALCEGGEGLAEEELDRKLSLMNEDFSSRGISPGGCADLLSCAMLLKDFEENCLR
ncbi:MAG: citrate lyase holo-[Firmicutes bacterium]|nr:citrate lyase holo-[acyl-carrier protein] synthase [Bacillota bacterium]